MTTSETIRKVCEDMGVTHAELARRTGQLPSTLSRKLKNGTVTMDEFRKYMELMNVSCDINLRYGDGTEWTSRVPDDRLTGRIGVLEARLEAAEKDSALMADLSRDIRTELANAVGCAELAESSTGDRAKYADYMGRLKMALKEIEKSASLMLGEEYTETDGPEAMIDPAALAGLNVLIAEDNDVNREIIRDILAEMNIQTEEATDGKQVVDRIRNASPGQYSMILMDMEMPVMDGCEASRLIRAQANRIRAGIPIIAITAGANRQNRRKAMESGMDAFVTKPINRERLLRELVKFV